MIQDHVRQGEEKQQGLVGEADRLWRKGSAARKGRRTAGSEVQSHVRGRSK